MSVGVVVAGVALLATTAAEPDALSHRQLAVAPAARWGQVVTSASVGRARQRGGVRQKKAHLKASKRLGVRQTARRRAPRWSIVADTVLVPGVRYQRYRVVAAAQHQLHVVRVRLRQPGLEVKLLPVLLGQRETLADLVRRYDSASSLGRVVAAVNGYFWSRFGALPIGIAAADGEPLQIQRYKRWSVFALDRQATAYVDTFCVELAVRLPHGVRLPVHAVNVRRGAAENVLYTRFAGDTVPRHRMLAVGTADEENPDSLVLLSVPADTVEYACWKIRLRYLRGPFLEGDLPCLVLGVDSGSVTMPLRGCVVSLGAEVPQGLLPRPGDTVWLESRLSPPVGRPVLQMWSGTPRLIRHGRVRIEAEQEGTTSARFLYRRRARTALGLTRTGELLLVVVEDGYGFEGATVAELAQWMRRLGVYEALNLDGGSSSGLYLAGMGTVGSMLPVASAIAIVQREARLR